MKRLLQLSMVCMPIACFTACSTNRPSNKEGSDIPPKIEEKPALSPQPTVKAVPKGTLPKEKQGVLEAFIKQLAKDVASGNRPLFYERYLKKEIFVHRKVSENEHLDDFSAPPLKLTFFNVEDSKRSAFWSFHKRFPKAQGMFYFYKVRRLANGEYRFWFALMENPLAGYTIEYKAEKKGKAWSFSRTGKAGVF